MDPFLTLILSLHKTGKLQKSNLRHSSSVHLVRATVELHSYGSKKSKWWTCFTCVMGLTPLSLRGQKLQKLDFPVLRLLSLTVCRSLLKLVVMELRHATRRGGRGQVRNICWAKMCDIEVFDHISAQTFDITQVCKSIAWIILN